MTWLLSIRLSWSCVGHVTFSTVVSWSRSSLTYILFQTHIQFHNAPIILGVITSDSGIIIWDFKYQYFVIPRKPYHWSMITFQNRNRFIDDKISTLYCCNYHMPLNLCYIKAPYNNNRCSQQLAHCALLFLLVQSALIHKWYQI